MEERVAIIPPGQVLTSNSKAFRIVFFFEGGVELLLPDGTILVLGKGDALSISHPWRLRFQGVERSREVRQHIFQIRFRQSFTTEPAIRTGDPSQAEQGSFLEAIHRRLSGFQYFPGALEQGNTRALHHLLRKGAERTDPSTPWATSSLCMAMLSELIRQPAPGQPLPSHCGKGDMPIAVEHTLQCLQENLHAAHTLSSVAWKVQLSGEHLARLFRRHVGCTVFDYLRKIRIERAKQLLRTTELRVVAIGQRCGYPRHSLFFRHFKVETGMTPRAYRNRGKDKENFTPSTISYGGSSESG